MKWAVAITYSESAAVAECTRPATSSLANSQRSSRMKRAIGFDGNASQMKRRCTCSLLIKRRIILRCFPRCKIDFRHPKDCHNIKYSIDLSSIALLPHHTRKTQWANYYGRPNGPIIPNPQIGGWFHKPTPSQQYHRAFNNWLWRNPRCIFSTQQLK